MLMIAKEPRTMYSPITHIPALQRQRQTVRSFSKAMPMIAARCVMDGFNFAEPKHPSTNRYRFRRR